VALHVCKYFSACIRLAAYRGECIAANYPPNPLWEHIETAICFAGLTTDTSTGQPMATPEKDQVKACSGEARSGWFQAQQQNRMSGLQLVCNQYVHPWCRMYTAKMKCSLSQSLSWSCQLPVDTYMARAYVCWTYA